MPSKWRTKRVDGDTCIDPRGHVMTDKSFNWWNVLFCPGSPMSWFSLSNGLEAQHFNTNEWKINCVVNSINFHSFDVQSSPFHSKEWNIERVPSEKPRVMTNKFSIKISGFASSNAETLNGNLFVNFTIEAFLSLVRSLNFFKTSKKHGLNRSTFTLLKLEGIVRQVAVDWMDSPTDGTACPLGCSRPYHCHDVQ